MDGESQKSGHYKKIKWKFKDYKSIVSEMETFIG